MNNLQVEVLQADTIRSARAFIGSGPDYLVIDSTGHLTMHGYARPWRDEFGDLSRVRVQGTGVSIDDAEQVIVFASNADLSDYAPVKFQLNHDRDEASVIKFHFHWQQVSANIPNFLLQYRVQRNGYAKETNWTHLKYSSNAFTYVSGTLNQITSFPEIELPAGSGLSTIIETRLLRDTDNTSTLFVGADPQTGNISVSYLDPHLQINSLGSTDEYRK